MQILPQDIVNQAIDSLGSGAIVGSLEDGTKSAEAARRVYGTTLRQLLRAAHWSFCRKQAKLLLLADSSGMTIDPGTNQPISRAVESPWLYAYAWPTDGVQARWLPWNTQQQTVSNSGTTVMVPNLTILPVGAYLGPAPARFLVSTSDQFPAEIGQVDWDNMPDLPEGQGPIMRRVVLTNVQNASLVYTYLALEIEMWDALFREAMVAVLASRLAMPILVDTSASAKDQAAQRGAATGLRNAQIAIAKDAIREARVASANEAGFPQSTDQTPDWIRARRFGGGYADVGFGGWDTGIGYLWQGWSSFGFADGTVF